MLVPKSISGALTVAIIALKDTSAESVTDLYRADLDEIVAVLQAEADKPENQVLLPD